MAIKSEQIEHRTNLREKYAGITEIKQMQDTKTQSLLCATQCVAIRYGQNQSGAVLITALVLLAVMTLLGLTTMSTSTIEERIAANNQEINRSFQVADAGLTQIFMDTDSLDASNEVGSREDNIGSYNAVVEYRAELRQVTPVGRNANVERIWSSNYAQYHFELASIGTTRGGIRTELNGGIVQIAPR